MSYERIYAAFDVLLGELNLHAGQMQDASPGCDTHRIRNIRGFIGTARELTERQQRTEPDPPMHPHAVRTEMKMEVTLAFPEMERMLEDLRQNRGGCLTRLLKIIGNAVKENVR